MQRGCTNLWCYFFCKVSIVLIGYTVFCRPNEELVVDIEVDMIGGVSGASVWTLVPSSIGDVRGTLVTEEFSLHCLRVTCGFIEHKAAVSHEELFQKIKEDLEKS